MRKARPRDCDARREEGSGKGVREWRIECGDGGGDKGCVRSFSCRRRYRYSQRKGLSKEFFLLVSEGLVEGVGDGVMTAQRRIVPQGGGRVGGCFGRRKVIPIPSILHLD